MHDSLPRGRFQIERRDLHALRKFIQIMRCRKQTLYFDDTHPDNSMSAEFLNNPREGEGLNNGIEVWLHFLAYFLRTPHQDLVDRAHRFEHKVDLNMMFRSIFDFIANSYNHLASDFHLGVVEAADGTEFVMSNNSFGLWEGKMDGFPDAHRLFIVSPRVALILLSNLIAEDAPRSSSIIVHSALIDIPIKRVEIHFSNGRVDMSVDELLHHQASAASQRDEVHFEITKLTERQTQNVNATTLLNANTSGSITFLSKDAMHKTVEKYVGLSGPLVAENRSLFVSLMDQLINGVVGAVSTPSGQSAQSNGASDSLRNSPPPNVFLRTDFKKNKRINALLDDISAGKVSCKSNYDRARQVYQIASKDEKAGLYVLGMVEKVLPLLVAGASDIIEMIRPRKEIIQINPFGTLVETLPAEQSMKVMAPLKELVSEDVQEYGDPEIDNVLYDAIWAYVLPVLIPEVPLVES
ncbi:hypothetical protein F5887DRAFT_947085 [Amanita rubescens]|nr:hypothetical protein F5887DRAFT_947085 [Amanita rubescens]